MRQSLPPPLSVELMRHSGGNGNLLTLASEWVVWGVSLLSWTGLLLGKCALLILSTRREAKKVVKKVPLMWGAEQK